MLSLRRLLSPLSEPAFRRLAAGRAISFLGDWLVAAALVGWIYAETGSTAHVALLLLVRLVPLTLGAAFAGIVVDRCDRLRLLVGLEVARVAAAASVFASIASSSRASVYAGVAAFSLLAGIAGVAARALAPATIDADRLPAANAQLAVTQETAMALGALAAGLTMSASAAATALAFAVVAFAIATLAYLRIRVVSAPPPLRTRRDRSLRAGFRHIAERPTLRTIVAAFTITTLGTGLVNATLPRFLGDELGLGAGAYGYGLAALALGLVAGEGAAGLARLDHAGARAFGATIALMALGLGALAIAPTAAVALAALAAIGFVNGIGEVLFETLAQRAADPAYYGRVFGLSSSLFRTTMMGSVAAAPLVNAVASPAAAIAAAAVVLLAAGCFAMRGDRLGVVRHPAPAASPS